MVVNVRDHTKYLYHYTDAKTAIEFILKNRTLKFGPYTGTNDPKERKNWLFDFGTNQGRDLGGGIIRISSLAGSQPHSKARRCWPALRKMKKV